MVMLSWSIRIRSISEKRVRKEYDKLGKWKPFGSVSRLVRVLKVAVYEDLVKNEWD